MTGAGIELCGYRGARIGVLGVSRSGRSALRALIRAGAEVLAFDDAPAALEAARGEGAWIGEGGEALDALLVSPGVPLTHPEPHPLIARAIARRTPILSDVDLFRGAIGPRRVIGITGSNGKSTVTALLAHVLRTSGIDAIEGGNIGKPALDLEPGPLGRRFVLELSSFQLDLSSALSADLAISINLSPDHLDRHGSFERYAAAKARLLEQAKPGAPLVIGADDPSSRALAQRFADRRPIAISGKRALDHGVGVEAKSLIARLGGEEERFELARAPWARGAAGAQNAAAVWAAARAEGATPEAIARGFASFEPLEHRAERVVEADGVAFVNDSKATNVASALASLEGGRDLFWIAGGRAKGEDFAPLAAAARAAVRKAYLLGESASALGAALEGVARERCDGLDRAVERAAADARAAGGGTVLLAPACASFDQFENYEARGRAFAAAARRAAARGLRAERTEPSA